jgi:hypothetical protein
VNVTVTTAGGTSATSSADQFTFEGAPTATAVSPAAGPLVGATSVTITGTNFTGASAVTFGSTAATSYTVSSATSITATSPAESAGTVNVTVTTPVGTSATSPSDQFTYTSPPTVTGVSPASGSTGGGTAVNITGTNLAGSSVDFGSVAATSVIFDSTTELTAVSPAGSAGVVNVTVTTPGGTSATSSADQFTYGLAPTVTGISPSTGPVAGGTTVTVTGTNFISGATTVWFGGAAGTSVSVQTGGMSLTVISPPGTTNVGGFPVNVTTPSGTSTNSVDFTYTAATTASGQGYLLAGQNGAIYAYGNAPFNGSMGTVGLEESPSMWFGGGSSTRIVGITATTGNSAYYIASNNGWVCGFGAGGSVAIYTGSVWVTSEPNDCYNQGLGSITNIVAIATTPNGSGYWLVTSTGTVYAYNVSNYGSAPAGNTIVGIAPTSAGTGYWLVGSNGGIFNYGGAGYYSSLTGLGVMVSNIVGMAPTTDNHGYWIIGSDGGVFCLGDAGFHGSSGGDFSGSNVVVAMAATPDSNGYWTVRGEYGQLLSYGDAAFLGSTDSDSITPIAGMAN